MGIVRYGLGLVVRVWAPGTPGTALFFAAGAPHAPALPRFYLQFAEALENSGMRHAPKTLFDDFLVSPCLGKSIQFPRFLVRI